MNIPEFEKSKIYENLKYEPEPPGYSSKIPWTVQQQIGATNGIHYLNEIGKLTRYPIPEMPIQPATGSGKLMLDIGCGWGRWLVAGGEKKYIPVGIDFRLEFCETAINVTKENGIKGYTVVADLKELPFKNDVFDFVWSFSVIQHTHFTRLQSCIRDIARILQASGFCKLEFPNKSGLRNRLGPVKKVEVDRDDYNSWSVRYYTIKEYEKLFREYFDNFSVENHSFLGIGILENDLDFVKDKKTRMQIRLSLALSKLTQVLPFLKNYSDSIYIQSRKKSTENKNESLEAFLQKHEQEEYNNLNLVPLLRCPVSAGDLFLNEDRTYLISTKASKKFPVVNNVPILVRSQAESL